MDSEEAFAYLLELYLRALPNMDVPLDGFTFLRVLDESNSYFRAVGISYVLPYGKVPVEVELSYDLETIGYYVLVGDNDMQWRKKNQSQRWKAVYLYATENISEAWEWRESIEGELSFL